MQVYVSQCCGCFKNLAVVAQCDSSEVLWSYLPQPLKMHLSLWRTGHIVQALVAPFSVVTECVCRSQQLKAFDGGFDRVSKFLQKHLSHFKRAKMFLRKVTASLWHHETLSGTCQSFWCSTLHLPLGAVDRLSGRF